MFAKATPTLSELKQRNKVIFSKAVEEIIKQKGCIKKYMYNEELFSLFNWSTTLDGWNYWDNINSGNYSVDDSYIEKTTTIVKKENTFLTIGIELTFLPSWYGEFRNLLIKRKIKKSEDILETIAKNLAENVSFYSSFIQNYFEEMGVLEVPTKTLNSRNECIKAFKEITKELKEEDFVSSSSVCIEHNGGAHIHFDGQTDIHNVYNFLRTYPSISWLFLGYNDNETAVLKLGVSQHDCVVHCNNEYNTTELRFFMMPRNLKEFLVHIDFAQKLMLFIKDNKYKPIIKKYSDYTYNKSVKELKEVCELINFPFKRLEFKLPILKQRFINGKEYLN